MTQKAIFPVSISKFAAVCDLPLTAVKFLCKEGLIPKAGGGKHGYKLQFDHKSLVYGCAIAAMSKAGIGVKSAGRLLDAIDSRWGAYVILLHDALSPIFPGNPQVPPAFDVMMELIDGKYIWVHGGPSEPLLMGSVEGLILERKKLREPARDIALRKPSTNERQKAAHARVAFKTRLTINLSAYCREAAARLD